MNKHSRLPEPVQAPVGGTEPRSNDRGYGPHCAQNPLSPATERHPSLAQAGFTLTELVVAVALIGILSAVAVSSVKPVGMPQVYKNAVADIAQMQPQRSQVVTDGTTAGAIALGLPPDARGVIDAVFLRCQTNPASALCEDDPNATYVRLELKTLRANGQLEPIRHTDIFQFKSHGGGNFDAVYVFAAPLFTANLDELYQVDTFSNRQWFGGRNYGIFTQGNVGENTPHRTICYQNSTCDPVSYLIYGFNQTGCLGQQASMISISMTGSILSKSVDYGAGC